MLWGFVSFLKNSKSQRIAAARNVNTETEELVGAIKFCHAR